MWIQSDWLCFHLCVDWGRPAGGTSSGSWETGWVSAQSSSFTKGFTNLLSFIVRITVATNATAVAADVTTVAVVVNVVIVIEMQDSFKVSWSDDLKY